MRQLTSFTQVSLDGYYADANSDMSWAHQPRDDAEWNAYVAGNAGGGGTLVFGRVTYQMMAGYWPSPMALANDPVVAGQMNSLSKIVFSRTLSEASWSNTTLVSGDLVEETRRLKRESPTDMVILGSGSIVAQLARAGLIDGFHLVVNPIVLGAGKKLFEGIGDRIALKRTEARPFGNGNVVLRYEPAP